VGDKNIKRSFVLIIVILLLTFLSLCPYFNNVENLVIDVFSNFIVQYTVILLFISIYCILKRKLLLSLVFLILFSINIFTSWNFNNGVVHALVRNENNESFKIYSANINKDNKGLSMLINEIKIEKPEITLLIEVRPRHFEELAPLIDQYKYRLLDPKMYISNVGIVFLSTYPIMDYNIVNLSDHGNAIIKSRLKVKGRDVIFYGVHLPRIGIDRGFKVRQKIFIRLASQIAGESMPVIIAGDFNTTPYSPVFKKFIKISQIKDSSEEFGWQPTWPTFFPPLWIPIDHVLVSQEIQVVNKDTGSYIGSDHYSVMATLSFR